MSRPAPALGAVFSGRQGTVGDPAPPPRRKRCEAALTREGRPRTISGRRQAPFPKRAQKLGRPGPVSDNPFGIKQTRNPSGPGTVVAMRTRTDPPVLLIFLFAVGGMPQRRGTGDRSGWPELGPRR